MHLPPGKVEIPAFLPDFEASRESLAVGLLRGASLSTAPSIGSSREVSLFLCDSTDPIECYLMRLRLAILVIVGIFLLVFVVWRLRSTRPASRSAISATS